MINVTFTESEIIFQHTKSGRTHVIRNNDYPETLAHPRHLIAKFGDWDVFRKAMRKVAGFRLLSPRVNIEIQRVVLGGIADADFVLIGTFFTNAGARDVTFKQRPNLKPRRL